MYRRIPAAAAPVTRRSRQCTFPEQVEFDITPVALQGGQEAAINVVQFMLHKYFAEWHKYNVLFEQSKERAAA